MTNIYKYNLDWTTTQTVKCRAIKILDIQIQNEQPVMWVVTSDDVEEQKINILLGITGGNVLEAVKKFCYISTTQCNGFVGHWFVEFECPLDEDTLNHMREPLEEPTNTAESLPFGMIIHKFFEQFPGLKINDIRPNDCNQIYVWLSNTRKNLIVTYNPSSDTFIVETTEF